MRYLLVILCLVASLPSYAQANDPLDDLLRQMQDYQQEEKALYRERETRFLKERNRQKALLKKAEAEFLAAQKANNPIQKRVDANQASIDALRKELNDELTALGDVYSIHQEFAGDFAARLEDSLTQLQMPERAEQLAALTDTQVLPDIEQMQELWLLVQQEMIEAGKIQAFETDVLLATGIAEPQEVVRIGTFGVAGSEGMLQYLPASGDLLVPARQPSTMQQTQKEYFNDAKTQQGMIDTAVVDPTRGSLLGLLGQSPSLMERVQQGKEVGLVIIAVGVIGLLIALVRALQLFVTSLKVNKQLKQLDQPSNKNPLGRVLLQAQGLHQVAEDLLQSKLDEAILKEIPALERGQGLIKLLAAIAPLMGLLGTVIGMIATFQSISLFGSGDPKLMASGISQALVTTVLGLVAAIPLLLAHNLVAAMSRSQIQILDEQSAGILARHLEQQRCAQTGD